MPRPNHGFTRCARASSSDSGTPAATARPILGIAREYLEGALLCRYDHPATDCWIMGQEIDRRLALTARED
jgi:hypothetical protein